MCVSGNARGYFISHPWEELHLWALSVYMYCKHKRFHVLVEILVDVEVQCNVLFPRPYGGAYSQSPIPQLEQDVGMGHLSSHPLPQTGNPGSITEIECTLLSGSAKQDALTMKESPLKNLILFFLRPHPSWGWLQNV